MKKIFIDLLFDFCIFILFFYFVNMNFGFYLIFIVAVLLYTFLKYPVKKNIYFYSEIIIMLLANTAAFYISEILKGKIYNIYYILSAIIVFILSIILVLYCKDTIEKNNTVQELFSQRAEDLKRLEKYIERFPTVGLNGRWGSGKSFLTDRLENKILVKIDLLSCNLNQIEYVIFYELERVLKQNGLFSVHSRQIKKILNNGGFFEKMAEIALDSDCSYSRALDEFRKNLRNLGKDIIIVYEDIDRVEKREEISKIFNISEKIAGGNIKVLYQFSQENLYNKGFDRNYLEKYIPYTVNLTEISLEDLISYVMKLDGFRNISIEKKDLDFLLTDLYMPYISRLKRNIKIYFFPENLSVRKVKLFLSELDNALNEKEVYIKNKKEVIVFFYIKHFFHPIYERLIPSESLKNIFLFEYENKKYDIYSLMQMLEKDKDKLEKALINKENIVSSFVLSIFEYNLNIGGANRNYDEIVCEDVKKRREKNSNEKKDRIVWSLLNRGKSSYTNIEYVVDRFEKIVLCSPKEIQNEKYKEFFDEIFSAKNDNETIFLYGIDSWISLFQAFCIIDMPYEKWIEVIDIYFKNFSDGKIYSKTVEILLNVDLEKRGAYLYSIRKFNSLEICNCKFSVKVYGEFLERYIRGFSNHGYCDTYDIQTISSIFSLYYKNFDLTKINEFKTIKFKIKNGLKLFEDRLISIKNEMPEIKVVKDDIETLINFVEKNQQIIEKVSFEKNIYPKIKSEISTRFKNQETVDELKKMDISKKETIEKMEKLYIEDKLSVYEIKNIKK